MPHIRKRNIREFEVLRQKQQLLARLPFLLFREQLPNEVVQSRIELKIVGVHRFNEIVHRAGAKVNIDLIQFQVLGSGCAMHTTRADIKFTGEVIEIRQIKPAETQQSGTSAGILLYAWNPQGPPRIQDLIAGYS